MKTLKAKNSSSRGRIIKIEAQIGNSTLNYYFPRRKKKLTDDPQIQPKVIFPPKISTGLEISNSDSADCLQDLES